MLCMSYKKQTIAHFIGLSGIGGVQSNFIEYMRDIELHPSKYHHKVYTIGSIDAHYKYVDNVFDIRKISNLYKLMLDIVSQNVIVHFYNNLSSFKVVFFLALLPVRKLVVHERGTIWSQKSASWMAPRFVAWKAFIIISNSFATKTMLVKKMSISEAKIQVLHNGVSPLSNFDYINYYKKDNFIFYIGFIGRLDTPKGVHVLIEAMRYLINSNIRLIIAGSGILENSLKEQASDLENVSFIGRIMDPYSFLSDLDLLVVPSIREPLGNVCLEAGLCKTPVLATNIDGIPEIIEDGVTGELIDATDKILINLLDGAVPLPEFVVNPVNHKLQEPKQINSFLLAGKILELSKRPKRLARYAENLHEKVSKYFSISRYRSELHGIYHRLFFED
jgi:glycosyltransferase involved in cell wall biosynthesis